ncbi:MAG: PqqD family peptide modification chaperone [Lachnospiraceae bacterium]|nr:PqqD family peptide modification chaperone [Lachnospiraceae bacterium]
MKYIAIDKDIYIEKYVMNRYFLCISNTSDKYMINDVAYEIIKRIDGTRKYNELFKELADLYKDTEENVAINVNEFISQLEDCYNLYIEEYDLQRPKEIKVIGEVSYFPQAASIEITESCNLKCLHCYGGFGEGCTNVMSLDNIKKVIDDLDSIGVKTLELTGGDISTHAGLKEVIEYALSLSFIRINLLTNGIILKDEVIDLIVKHKDKIEIQIDLHSLNDDYLFWFTKCKNSIEIIKGRIEYFLSKNVKMRIATIFTSRNLNEFMDIAEWLGKRNLKWGIGLVEKLGRAIESDKSLYLDYQQIVSFQKMIEKANFLYPGMISFIDYHPNDCNCGAMTSHVVIDSYGRIKLCTMDNGTYFNNKMGNCISKNIQENYKDNLEFIKALTTYQIPNEESKECYDCKEYYACGHCLLRNFINMKEKKYNCEWYKKNVPEIVKEFFFN